MAYEQSYDNTFIINSRAYYFDGSRWYESVMYGDQVSALPIDRSIVTIAASAFFGDKTIDIVGAIEKQHAKR